ncbi:MAG TPA: LamG domain-containing protein [Candidatus Woesebacteria bacterium]|nr:LamG domain-containing protein [Candidatus Woesebacteria bacterium]
MNKKDVKNLPIYSVIVIIVSLIINALAVKHPTVTKSSALENPIGIAPKVISSGYSDGRKITFVKPNVNGQITAIGKNNQTIIYGTNQNIYLQDSPNNWTFRSIGITELDSGSAQEFISNQYSSDPNTYLKYQNKIFRLKNNQLFSLPNSLLGFALVPFGQEKLIATKNNQIYYADFLNNQSVWHTLPIDSCGSSDRIFSAFNYQNQVYLMIEKACSINKFLYHLTTNNTQVELTKVGPINLSRGVTIPSLLSFSQVVFHNQKPFLLAKNNTGGFYYANPINFNGQATTLFYNSNQFSNLAIENRKNYLNIIAGNQNDLKQLSVVGVGNSVLSASDFNLESFFSPTISTFQSIDSNRLIVAHGDSLTILDYPQSSENKTGFNQSLWFDHRGSVQVPLSIQPSTQFTIEGYFKYLDSSDKTQVILSKQYYYEYSSFIVSIDRINHKLLFRTYNGQSLSPHLYSQQSLEPGKWYHFAITIDQNVIRMYLNGQEQGVVRMNNPMIFDNTKPLFIGNYQNESLYGLVDEVRISNTVRYDHNSRFPNQPFINDEHTLLLMHFDNNLNDSSSYQNKGVLKNVGEFLDIIRHDPS